MKTLKDIHSNRDSFLNKNDKLCVLEFINSNSGLFSGDYMVGLKKIIYHHKTRLEIFVHSAGQLAISKAVDSVCTYQYNSYINFLVK